MKNKKKTGGLSPLQLALIITGSIVAAAGIIVLILQICKKKCNKKAVDACCCEDMEDLDAWDLDEDILSELEFDDDECCHCDECCESAPDAIDEAVEEAIEAIEEVAGDDKAE